MGRAEAGLQEHTAVGDGLQRGRALVGEPKANEELQGRNTVLLRDFPPQGNLSNQPNSIPSLLVCSCA